MGLRFPVFLDIEDKKILLVGAGQVAARRIRTLLLFGADITVIAREVPERQRQEMEGFLRTGRVRLSRGCLQREDITPEYLMVICAADDPEADLIAEERCRDLGIPVNIASDRKRSDFYFPAIVAGEDLSVGIAGDGKNHRKTARAAALIRRCLAQEDETKKTKETGHEDHSGKQTEPSGRAAGADCHGGTEETSPGGGDQPGHYEDHWRPDPEQDAGPDRR